MTLRRSLVRSLGYLAVGAIALSACTSAPASGSESIVFRSFDPPAEAAGLKRAVEKWNKENAVQVRFETVAIADALAQYTREVNGGGGPDISQTAFVWVRELGKSGLVADLSKYVSTDAPGSGITDFLGLDINQLDGKTFGVPWSVDTYALAYQPDALKEVGVADIPTNWKDFADLAARLTTSKRSGFCFAASSAPTSDAWHLLNYYLWSFDTPLVRESGGKFEVGATEAQIAEAFRYLNDFFTRGTTPSNMISIDNAGDPAVNSALADGRCAIAFMTPTNLKVARQTSATILTAPVPTGTVGTPTTHLGGRSLTVNPNSKNPDAAWKFVKFLTSEGFFKEFYAGQFPAQASLVKAISFGDEMRGFQKELPTARAYTVYVNSPAPTSKYWSLTAQTLSGVFSGQTTPEQASVDFSKALAALVKG